MLQHNVSGEERLWMSAHINIIILITERKCSQPVAPEIAILELTNRECYGPASAGRHWRKAPEVHNTFTELHK